MGNAFSSKAMSRSEIAKRAGSTGAASGLFRSRFRSQSLIATRSSRNAALTNASKNWSRCAGSSLDQPQAKCMSLVGSAQVLSHAIRNRLLELGINKPPAEREPGVKGFTMHGLRKNAGIELALAGCSVSQIMAVLGHKTEKMALFYVAQAKQDELNESAVDMWDALLEKKTAMRAAQRRDRIRAVA